MRERIDAIERFIQLHQRKDGTLPNHAVLEALVKLQQFKLDFAEGKCGS